MILGQSRRKENEEVNMKRYIVLLTLSLAFLVLGSVTTFAENINPNNDDSRYAFGENVGWFNFEPGEGPGVTVTATEVTGFAWAENIGWVNLSPTNYGGVTNDGNGTLSGYAWGENVGWINFAPAGGGVTIDDDGEFDGWAWGENIGWIHFRNLSIPYKVQTAWVPGVQECPGDFNDDGKVDGLDFIIFRNGWGSTDCGTSLDCPADMNGDGKVDGLDFIEFRNNWGSICQ
jgi:hypothetical protein